MGSYENMGSYEKAQKTAQSEFSAWEKFRVGDRLKDDEVQMLLRSAVSSLPYLMRMKEYGLVLQDTLKTIEKLEEIMRHRALKSELDRINLREDMNQEEVIRLARVLVGLNDNPSPGTFMWHQACVDTCRSLAESLVKK